MAKKSRERQSDVLTLYRTFKPIPRNINLATASDRLLNAHGFPRKPDKKKEPDLQRYWDKFLKTKPRYKQAKLKIDDVLSRRDPLRHIRDKFSPSGWAGIIVQTSTLGLPAGTPATFVFGEWVVPEIYPVSGQLSSSQTVGLWVGIDGYGNGQVLQSGIAATITGTSVDYWVWTEWYTAQYMDPAVRVTNFKIKPGDLISFVVCAAQQDYGLVFILNSTTNESTSIGIDARPGILSEGASVEWIVEGVSTDLPNFFAWTFSNAIAGERGNIFNLRPHGITTEITGNGGSNLTESLIAGDGTGVVLWRFLE